MPESRDIATVPMLPLALLISCHLAQGPARQVTFVRFLPGSTRFVAAYGEVAQAGARPGTAAIWDAATGKRVRILMSKEASDVYDGDLSVDGSLLALGGTDLGPVEVFDVKSGRRSRSFDPQMNSYPGYVFLPGKPRLALIESARFTEYGHLQASICDLPDGEPVKLTGSDGASDVAADPHGKWLAVPVVRYLGSPNIGWNRHFQSRLNLYDLATATLEQSLSLPDDVSVSGLAFSPDGRRLAVRRQDGKVALWDTETWRIQTSLQTQAPAIGWSGRSGAPVFSPDGRRLALSLDQIGIAVYDLKTRRASFTVYAPSRTLWKAIAFSTDGRTLLVGTTDGTVESRSAATGKLLKTWPVAQRSATDGS